MVNDTVLVKIEVVNLDIVSDGTSEVEAWCTKVFVGEHLQTYWISKETNELLKQSIKLGEGVFFDFVR